MSQQLNLLPPEKLAIGPTAIALMVLGLVLVGLSAGWGINHFRLKATQERLVAAEMDLKETRAALQQRLDTKAALLAAIETSRPLAAAADALLKTINEVGSTAGFSTYFSTLADATEDGLWLTGVAIAKSRINQVDGQSLNSDAVVRFGHNLNAQFSAQGMQFTSVELNPQVIAPADGRPPLSSTRFVIR